MTYPITPDPAVHSYPPGYQSVPRSSGYVKGLAIQLIESLFNQLVQLLTNYLYALPGQIEQIVQSELQGLPGQFSHEAGTFLQALFQGLMPHAFDNLDGTAKPLTGQIVTNLDGTATIVNQLGSTAVNTVVDWADGTAMSMGAALQNVHSYFGTHNYAVQGLSTILGQTGTGTANQLVAALQGVIPAALDNLDGTAAVLGSQIKQNLDGTATYVAQVATQAANQANVTLAQATTGVNGLIDNLDGTAMSFFHAASQGVNNALGGLLHAFTGNPVTATTTTQAQQQQVVAAAGAIQQRLAAIGNGGEEQVDVNFSAFNNGGAPSAFTVISTSGTAPTVSGGLFTLTAVSASDTKYYYNAVNFLGDYHQVSAVVQTLTGGASSSLTLYARLNTAGTTCVFALIGPTTVTVIAAVGGVTEFSFTCNNTFTPGATYTLMCGDYSSTSLYKYQILKNGVPLTITAVTTGDATQIGAQYYNDLTQQSSGTIGSLNRNAGLEFSVNPSGTVAISDFAFQDTGASVPSVLVPTSESTSSTTYTDLATISDQVAVNIGTSGMAQVSIYSLFFNNVAMGDSFVGFAAAGANTIAASDAYSILANPPGSGHNLRLGGTFLLAGLTAGLTTFKMKYKAQSGTTATFQDRRIGVVAL